MLLKSNRTLTIALLIAPLALPIFAFAKQNSEPLPLDDLQRFTAVVEQIRKYYVKPVEDKELFENAIRGMLAGLDPHSSYLDPNEFSDLRVSTSGKFGGLGIEVTMDEGFVRVISPIDDTPAAKAGIKAGDMIVKLDEAPVKGMTLKKAVEMMRGEKGKPILLTILRKGETSPLKINVIRDNILVKSIKTKLFDKQYGYVRLSQFQTQTGEDLLTAVQDLNKQAGGKVKGILLDLRNNPGGILESSVKVSDLFLDKSKLKHNGLIVYTEGRLPGSQMKEAAQSGDVLEGAPIVVLVNGGSASASEIVAGALQDHQRALIVGLPTFGKGSVQTVLPLKENFGLKLTTALYYTPSGRSIQAEGIKPDIEIPDIKMPQTADEENNLGLSIRESDLEGHLANDVKTSTKEALQPSVLESTQETLDQTQKAEEKAFLTQDYQLNEALNLLKGIAFIENRYHNVKKAQNKIKEKALSKQKVN